MKNLNKCIDNAITTSRFTTHNTPKEIGMNRIPILTRVLILALTLFVVSGLFAQEKKKTQKKMPSQDEMMKRWQEAMTPGDAHNKLQGMLGTWDAEVKSWMSGPDGEPMVSKGVSENTSVLGGRFVQQTFTGDMMNQPFNGTGFTGYDNFKRKYVGFWIDNMTTAISTMEGTLDKDGTTMTMWGKTDDPMTRQKDKKVKYVSRVIDKDKMVFDYYDVTSYGDKKPVMQITYTRKKS